MYPEEPLGLRMEVALDADLTADPDTYTWTDVTSDLALTEPITVKRGSEDEQAQTSSALSFTLRDNDGRYAVGNPLSDLHGRWRQNTPVRYSVNAFGGGGWKVRALAYLSSVTHEWPSGTPHRCLAHVQADGLFRRLGQGRALNSTIWRSQMSMYPRAYWPIEDGRTATVAASALSEGGTPLYSVGPAVRPEFASRTGLAGSREMAVIKVGAGFAGAVRAYPHADEMMISFAMHMAKAPASDIVLMRADCEGGSITRWELVYTSGGSFYARAYDPAGNELLGAGLYLDLLEGQWLWIDLWAETSGTDVYWEYAYGDWVLNPTTGDIDPTGSWDAGTAVGQSLGNIRSIALAPNLDVDDVAFGHLTVHSEPIPGTGGYGAIAGWAGETVAERIVGFAAEHGLTGTSSGAGTARMGPQPAGKIVDVIRDCGTTDHGILDDGLGRIDLTARGDLYGRDVAIELDGTVRGEIALPTSVVYDDSKRRTQVTAKQPKGSEVTWTDADQVARVGLYEGDTSPNVSQPVTLLAHAQHVAAVGMGDVARWPALSIDLLRAPQLVDAWLAVELGSRVRAINAPPQLGDRTIEGQVRGWTETFLGRRKWAATMNLAPYRPWEAFERGGEDNLGRRDASASTIASAVPVAGGGATSTVSVATSTGPLWTIDVGDFPLDIEVLPSGASVGERMTVTGISGAASPQAFTVIRGVNGLTKSHNAGDTVRLWHAGVRSL
jgi:hypothetical protein